MGGDGNIGRFGKCEELFEGVLASIFMPSPSQRRSLHDGCLDRCDKRAGLTAIGGWHGTLSSILHCT